MAPVSATFALIGMFRLFGYFTDARVDSRGIHQIVGDFARVAPGADAGELRVVTWNIRNGARFNQVLDQIRRLDADIYLLQEVDVFCRRSGNRNVAKDLADAIGVNWAFAGEFQEIGESTGRVPALTGQAILSRYPIAEAAAVPFRAQAWARWHLNPVQPRRGGRLVLHARIRGLRVYNAHLESGRDDALRRKQLDDILAADASDRPAATAALIAGDFNNGPIARSSLFAAITTASFVNALEANASSQTTGVHRHYPIDWIFVRHLQPTSGQVIRVDGASDHYPVTATLRLEKQVRHHSSRR